jgi:hypothetical protein
LSLHFNVRNKNKYIIYKKMIKMIKKIKKIKMIKMIKKIKMIKLNNKSWQ